MTPSDSPGPEIGRQVQTAHNYLLRGPSYAALRSPLAVMQNFATFEWLLWQQGSIRVNFNNTIRLPDPKNMDVVKHSAQLSFMGTELYRFEIPTGHNAIFFKLGKIGEGVTTFYPKQTRSYFLGPESLCKSSSRSN